MFINRRAFVKSASIAGFPLIIPASVLGKNAPSNRINLGFIGLGWHGVEVNLANFLNHPGAKVVAVCDAFVSRKERAKGIVERHYGQKGCRAYDDFRDLIHDREVDAVVISTPDHWHVPLSLRALEAGKDVFCEKPTFTIKEGERLIAAVKKHHAVFQAGLEDRSTIHYHKMVEWVRNGAIGEVQRVEVTLPIVKAWPREDPIPVPKDLNYNMYLGPADFIPYSRSITDPWHWRMIRNFSGGMVTDWGSHLVDTAQLAVDNGLPVEIEGTGSIPENSMTTVPLTFDIRYRFRNRAEIHVKSGGTSIRLHGTRGWVGNDGWMGRLRASDRKILLTKYPEGRSRHWKIPKTEHRNFIDCVKSRKPATYSAETIHQLSTILHMGLISIYTGEKLRWDSASSHFIGSPAANRLTDHRPRDWEHA